MSRLILVCFDVSDAKRLRRMANLLKDYGQRVQYSVFECHITQKDLAALQAKISALIAHDEDRVNVYTLCPKDEKKVHADGAQYLSQDKDYYII